MDTRDDAVTKPTLGTILERINSLGDEVKCLRNEFVIFRERVELRLDRIESMTNQTRAEMLTLRADFREFRTQLKESMA
jgi:hypothetical protein